MNQVEAAIPPGAKIDVGCGHHKKAGHIGIDLLDVPGVDIVADIHTVLEGVPDGHLSAVHSSHFLEHIADPAELLGEFTRVVAPGGELTIVVPHFSNPYYYSDLTHRTPWGLYTLGYLIEEWPFKRTVPQYREPLPLELVSARLVFKSPRPFYVRYGFKRAFGTLVNATRGLQEFYEENLVWLSPCYELRFELRVLPPAAERRPDAPAPA
jgi:SAM-dependent methyltransferase